MEGSFPMIEQRYLPGKKNDFEVTEKRTARDSSEIYENFKVIKFV